MNGGTRHTAKGAGYSQGTDLGGANEAVKSPVSALTPDDGDR
jgi:hypothetical protein